MAMQMVIGQMHLMALTTQEVNLLLALRENKELSNKVYELAKLPQSQQQFHPSPLPPKKEEEKRSAIQQAPIEQPQQQPKQVQQPQQPQQAKPVAPQHPNDDDDEATETDTDDSIYDKSDDDDDEIDTTNNNNPPQQPVAPKEEDLNMPTFIEAAIPPKPNSVPPKQMSKKEQEQYDADLEFARKLQEQYHRFEGGGDNANKPPPSNDPPPQLTGSKLNLLQRMNTQELNATLNGNPPQGFINDGSNKKEVATYQSEVYGNDQLKMRQENDDTDDSIYDKSDDDTGIINNNQSKECPICLKEFGPTDRRRPLPCLHTFHVDCIAQWEQIGKKSCPLCRTPIN